MKEELQTLIKEFNAQPYLSDHTEHLETALDYFDGDNADDFRDYFTENYIHTAEVIYYINAITFLKAEDPSLNESLQVASEMGFSLENLNSETLATLLLQQRLAEEFAAISSEIDDYFEAKIENESE